MKKRSIQIKDFIYECNRGNDIFFVADEQTVINKLANALKPPSDCRV